jgi:ACS family tartrate transporter-like MFS transporter
MIAIPLSQAIGAPLSGWLLGFDGRLGLHGWQWLFLVEGIPSVLLGVAVLGYLPDRAATPRWLSEEQRAWLGARLQREREGPGAASIHEPLRALTDPLIWLVSLPWFALLTTAYSFDFWAPIAIRDALHTSNGVTAAVFGAIGGLTAISTLLSGWISDRTQERFLHAAGSTLVIALGFVGAALLPRPWGLLIALTVVGVGQRAFYPPFWCIPTLVLGGRAAAVGIGLVNSIGSIGGFVGPAAVGLFKDTTGSMNGAFLVLAAVSLCAGGLLLVLRGHRAFVAVT